MIALRGEGRFSRARVGEVALKRSVAERNAIE
jgi:hypothetical protein